MDKKNIIIISSVVILVVVAGIIWYKISPTEKGVIANGVKQSQNSIFPTRQEAPKDVAVPEPGSTDSNSDVAVPKTSVPAAPGVEAKLRTFDIVASGGKYSPSTIIVRVGDTVHINFKAEDDTYDIVFPDYGLRQQAKKGETKIIEFQATTDGQFTFYCENACPKGKMQGTLIIAL